MRLSDFLGRLLEDYDRFAAGVPSVSTPCSRLLRVPA